MPDKKIVFLNNQDKLELLKSLNKDSIFLNLSFFNSLRILSEFKNSYYLYLKNNYEIEIDLAEKLKKYFDYIEISKTYKSEKLNLLKTIKKDLIALDILFLFDYSQYQNLEVKSYYDMPIPRLFKPKSIISVNPNTISSKDIKLYLTRNSQLSCYAVYQKIIDLLENNIDINNINIINTLEEDDYQLQKLFNDAKIPININKKTKITNYPIALKILEKLKSEGYNQAKELLKSQLNIKPSDEILLVILNLFNKYLDREVEEYPQLLINDINNASLKNSRFQNCVNIYDFDNLNYKEDNYYLVMNYNDSLFPKKVDFVGYLSKEELEEIGYMSNHDYNAYLENYYRSYLQKIDNLTLFFASKTTNDNRLSNLDLARNIEVIDYQYEVDNTTYLDSLNQLEYAKTKYDFENFYLKDINYKKLHNDYNKKVYIYNHEFTGIKQADLLRLITKNNSLTGAKVESYNLCRFQYLLKYLLKLEEFDTNINLYLGNLTHKALEEFVKDKNFNVIEFIDNYPDFPEEAKYKEPVFKKAMVKEIEQLLTIMKDFHDTTLFKTIKPELKFEIPLKNAEEFLIRGTIDKVMTYQDSNGTNYVALIDYKLGSSNDFDRERFEKRLQFQLPVYLYAYKKISDELATPLGFYYQKTSLGRYAAGTNAITKNYQLKGLSLDDKNILELFNPSLELIRGISVKKDGDFTEKSKNRIATIEDFKQILNQVEQGFIDMTKSLKIGDFKINPLNTYGRKQDSISCEYCTFSNICYNKNMNLGVEE